MVICVERGADLHIAQLMPLLLTEAKIQTGLPFWCQLTRVVPEKGPLNECVCVCPFLYKLMPLANWTFQSSHATYATNSMQ